MSQTLKFLIQKCVNFTKVLISFFYIFIVFLSFSRILNFIFAFDSRLRFIQLLLLRGQLIDKVIDLKDRVITKNTFFISLDVFSLLIWISSIYVPLDFLECAS